MEKEIENKFLSGLFWGLLIGGGLAVFLNSQSGRKLLKSISQQGLESILHLLEENKDLDEDYDYEEEASETPTRQDPGDGLIERKLQKPRRFFTGIRKKIYSKVSNL